MHQLALGTWQSDTGLGGVISIVFAVVVGLCRAGMMMRGSARRGARARRLPGGGFGYGAGPGQRGEPDSLVAPRDGTAGELHREQDHSYWEPQEQDGTLSAGGFIGDPGETGPPARQE